MSSFYQMETPLQLHADPVNPMHAVTKRYVDSKVTNVAGSRFVTGVIGVDKLPALVGDITSVVGTNVLNLNNSGVTAGVYNNVTVDSKGRITGGSYTGPNTTNLSWTAVQNTPTTLGGYGITDVVSTLVGDTVASVAMTGVQSTAANVVQTKETVDALIDSVSVSTVGIGEVVRYPSPTTPTGMLRSNGGVLDKASYAALYAIIGDTYSGSGGYMGQPWRQQYAFNSSQSAVLGAWTTGTFLPAEIERSQAIVTKNRVYLLGGYVNDSVSAAVYTAPINADGTLGAWTTGTDYLPVSVAYSQAILIKNRLYLLGGHVSSRQSATVYIALINGDGTLGDWTIGSSLPGGVSMSQAIVTKNRVYLLGGYVNDSVSAAVYTAPINADGTLGVWTTSTSLPAGVNSSQAIITKNRVYLLGGDIGSGGVSTVYTAPINADGTLGAWTTGTSLPAGVYRSQAVVTKNRVYLLGGMVSGGRSATVYTAPINEDGTLGAWTTGTSLPATVELSQAIVTSSKVYILGGSSIDDEAVYQADFTGGTNDYLTLINNNSINFSTQFKLPDYSSKETDNLYYYIKY